MRRQALVKTQHLSTEAPIDKRTRDSGQQRHRNHGGSRELDGRWRSGGEHAPHRECHRVPRSRSGLRYYTDSRRNAVAAVTTGITHESSGRARFDASDPVVFGPWMYRAGNGFVWGMFADGVCPPGGRPAIAQKRNAACSFVQHRHALTPDSPTHVAADEL